jgi:pilus assembly protein TadC
VTGALIVGLAVSAVMRYPGLLLIGLLPPLVIAKRRWDRRRRSEREAALDVVSCARTLLVGLAAGLPLTAAIDLATHQVSPMVGSELTRVLRAAHRQGMAAALAGSEGRLTRPLLSRLALAQTSGAPMSEVVAAFLTETRTTRRAQALERVRRLPVALMVPLGLLILPGFVVLFVGPIVLGSLVDLLGALP